MNLYDVGNPLLRPRPFWEEEEEKLKPVVPPVVPPPAAPELPEVEGEGYDSPEEVAASVFKPPAFPEVEGPGYDSPEEVALAAKFPEVEGPGFDSPEEVAASVKPPSLGELVKEVGYRTLIKPITAPLEVAQGEAGAAKALVTSKQPPPEGDKNPQFDTEGNYIPEWSRDLGALSSIRTGQNEWIDAGNSFIRGTSSEGGILSMGQGLYDMARAGLERTGLKDKPVFKEIYKNAVDQRDELAAMRERVNTRFPVDKDFQDTFGSVFSGLGQLTNMPLYVVPGVGEATTLGGLWQEAKDDYKQTVKEKGLPYDEAQADKAALQYLTAGGFLEIAADKLLIGRFLKSAGAKKWTIDKTLEEGSKSFLSEGTTEGAQQAWLNFVAANKGGYDAKPYDPNRPIGKDVGESFLVGGLVGAGGTVAGTVGAQAFRPPEAVPSAPAVPPPFPPTPPEAFAPPGTVPSVAPVAGAPGVTIVPAPGEVPVPPDLAGAPPAVAPPPVVPPVTPAAAVTTPELIEPGENTPAGAAVTQVTGAHNIAVKEIADTQARNLQAANAPQTAQAIQQLAQESSADATVTAAEFLQQAKVQAAEATAEAAAKAAPPIAKAGAPAVAAPVVAPAPAAAPEVAAPAERAFGVPPPLPGTPPEAFAPPAAPVVAVPEIVPAPQAPVAPVPAAPAVAEPQAAVVVGGQVFTGPTHADAVRAAHTAVGTDAMGAAEGGWVDPESGRFVSHDIFRAHQAFNTAIEQAGGNMEAPAVAEAGARLAEAQARDVEVNNQIVQPGGEQVVNPGIKGQEVLVSPRPSQELAVPLAGVTAIVRGVDVQGRPVTETQPAATALNDARNDRTALTILLDCLH
jgi:hypothetical protein